jgi:hypothetical protein
MPGEVDDPNEKPNRTGLARNELVDLGKELKRKRATEGAGTLSYVGRKRQSIDKFIEGAADSDAKATSDLMTVFMMMDARAASQHREHQQQEREWRAQEALRQEKRDERRDEMSMMFMAKMFESVKK